MTKEINNHAVTLDQIDIYIYIYIHIYNRNKLELISEDFTSSI